MASDPEGIYSIRVSPQALERQAVADLDEAARGALFIPWAKPPRVGTWVGVDLAFGDGPTSRIPGLVVWSRPPRPGVVPGFRAQLQNPASDVLQKLQTTVNEARSLAAEREAARKRNTVDGPIQERQRTWSELTPITGPIRMVTGGEPLPRPPREPTPRPPPAASLASPPVASHPDPFQRPISGPKSVRNGAPSVAGARAPALAAPPPSEPASLARPKMKPAPLPPPSPPPAPVIAEPMVPLELEPPALTSFAQRGQLPPLKLDFAEPAPEPVAADLPLLDLEAPATDPQLASPVMPPPPAFAPEEMSPRDREMEVVELPLEQDLSIDEWNLLPSQPPEDDLRAPPEPESVPANPPTQTWGQYAEAAGDLQPPAEIPEETPDEGEAGNTRPRWGIVTGREAEEAEPPPESPELAPELAVRITFSSTRTFLRHYDRFFEHGEVYVASSPVPSPGTLVRVSIGIPDGDVPVAAQAVVMRSVEPPEVPRAGWLARLVDMDGTIAERLATARTMLG